MILSLRWPYFPMVSPFAVRDPVHQSIISAHVQLPGCRLLLGRNDNRDRKRLKRLTTKTRAFAFSGATDIIDRLTAVDVVSCQVAHDEPYRCTGRR